MSAPKDTGMRSLARSKIFGRLSAFFFILAALCMADAVRAIVITPFNTIRITAGESILVSGAMPANQEDIKNLTFKFTDSQGLTFTFTEVFRGFWMGGNMWRGTLSAKGNTPSHKASFTVLDLIPSSKTAETSKNSTASSPKEKFMDELIQNPALIFPIEAFASPADAQRSSRSFIMQRLGTESYVLALYSFILAVVSGLVSFYFFQCAEKIFFLDDIFIIHGVMKRKKGITVLFATQRGRVLPADKSLILYTPHGEKLEFGYVGTSVPGKGSGCFTSCSKLPKYGWLVALERAPSLEGLKAIRQRNL